MIYVILYTTVAPGTQTGMDGCHYYGFAHTIEKAEKLFNRLELNSECIRKEIWSDDGERYRRLIKSEQYHAGDILEVAV